MSDNYQSTKFLEAIGLTLEDVEREEQPSLWLQIFNFCSSQDIIVIFDNDYNKYLIGSFQDLSDEDQSEVVDDFCTYAQQIQEDANQKKDVRVVKPNKKHGSS